MRPWPAPLLKAANSAFYGLRREVTTVEEVIAVLGMNQCNAIICGLVTKRTLGVGAMMLARFWDVSEKRARGMSFLAGETRAVAPEAAYNFGLFCDIGIPLLKAACPAYLDTLSIANREASERFLKVENKQHGVNHALVGAQLAQHWSISAEVVAAIGAHHNWWRSITSLKKPSKSIAVQIRLNGSKAAQLPAKRLICLSTMSTRYARR